MVPMASLQGTNWSVVPPPLESQKNVKPSGSAKSSVTFLSQLKQEAYGYEHPIARTPTEDMDSGVSSKRKSRLMVAVGIPSEQIVRTPRTSGGLAGISQAGSHESHFSARAKLMKHQAALDLAQKEVEDAQEDLRNEVEPATQKRTECMREVIDLKDQSQGTRTGPSSLDRLSPGLGLVPWTFDHPSDDVLEFENDKERARRLLLNTHRLLGAHVGEMVKGASNHRYSEFVQRGQEMVGLLTHAIKKLSDWYETLEVENFEGFEWDDLHGKRKAEYSP
ncbi:hypothetical protein PPACK8108_LOCUS18340 [Phakopsora pachyrhizi]|uniref:Uncharacterized protein n=1 Tax=Phakopsora pachyrhizi TaxID=170000 RepID=A0AAV0BCY2_PHAPC|nr:hypothetical protein PPACK8108_LOCUS18340 [Phakopsora pachyrhizi]